MSAKESGDLVSGADTASKSTQRSMDQLSYHSNWEMAISLMILSCRMVTTMCCHYLVILDTLRLMLRYFFYLLSILLTL